MQNSFKIKVLNFCKCHLPCVEIENWNRRKVIKNDENEYFIFFKIFILISYQTQKGYKNNTKNSNFLFPQVLQMLTFNIFCFIILSLHIFEIFEIKNGFYNKKPPCFSYGTIPFIGASDSNNGFTGFTTYQSIESNSKVVSSSNEILRTTNQLR